jgi:hypothetical protein
MTLFAFDNDVDDDLSELRAEAAAERRRLRPHWCSECMGLVRDMPFESTSRSTRSPTPT